jgi:hypothetical protein
MHPENSVSSPEGNKYVALLKTITHGKSKPLDEWELTALLETNGLRDIDAITDWGEPDLFALPKRLQGYVDSIPYETKKREYEKKRLWKIFKNYIKGTIFAFPMFIQIVAMIVVGFGIWSSINFGLREATAIAVGTLLALATTGGIAQMIGRKGLFYVKFEEYLLASKITKRLYLLGVIFIIFYALLFSLVNFYLRLFPFYMYQLFIIYFFLLSFLFLIFSVFYMLENYGTIALITLCGIVLIYIFLILLNFNLVRSQAFSLIIILLLSNLFAFYKIKKLEKKSQAEGTLLPKVVSLFYTLYPYFLYGTAYFLFLIMDRMLAWTTGHKQLPYVVWFNYPYEVGVDWALIPLISTIALVEVFIYELGYAAFKKINETKAPEVNSFNKHFLRVYFVAGVTFFIVGIISIILSYLFPYALRDIRYFFKFVDVFFNDINKFVFFFASIGYVLLSWSLLNCIIFFAYSRYKFALKSIGFGLMTNFLVGLIFSRAFIYYYSVIGLFAGSIVFAGMSTYYAYRFFRQYDYYYYSAY